MLFHILVEDSAPVDDEQSVWVVLRPGNPFKKALGHQLTHQHGCPALNTLTAIVGERHVLLAELNAVTENTEDGTRSHNIAIETFFLQGIVLGKASLVDEIHGLLHRVLDVLVIRGEGEEVVMEHLDMALGFHVKGLFHRAAVDENGYVAVEHVHFFLRVIDHPLGCPDAAEGDDHTAYEKEAAQYQHEFDFVF